MGMLTVYELIPTEKTEKILSELGGVCEMGVKREYIDYTKRNKARIETTGST